MTTQRIVIIAVAVVVVILAVAWFGGYLGGPAPTTPPA
jgi:hypothetical protein